MNAMLLTFGMAMCTSAVAEVKPAPQLHIQVRLYKGDPLGSRDEGTLKILAEPAIRALSGQTAMFQSGGQVAVPGVNGGVTFEPVGTSLKLTPVLHGDGSINLEVEAELSEVAPGRGVTLGNGRVVPAFNKQTMQTMRLLKDTQIVRVRIAASSPTDQTWAELTVHVVRPER